MKGSMGEGEKGNWRKDFGGGLNGNPRREVVGFGLL